MTPATCNVEQAAQILQCGTERTYALIDKGELPAAQIGRSFVLMTSDVIDYAAKQIAKQTRERLHNKPTTPSDDTTPTNRKRRKRLADRLMGTSGLTESQKS